MEGIEIKKKPYKLMSIENSVTHRVYKKKIIIIARMFGFSPITWYDILTQVTDETTLK